MPFNSASDAFQLQPDVRSYGTHPSTWRAVWRCGTRARGSTSARCGTSDATRRARDARGMPRRAAPRARAC
eukprot:31483-Pelagococcus_subviridis.AAC.1